MEIFFYCTPRDLQEVFEEAEQKYSLIYEPNYGYPVRIRAIDTILRQLFFSCADFYEFSRGFYDTLSFYIYAAGDKTRRIDAPNILHFSGTPAMLTDFCVLCEGSLFLRPESKVESART